MFDRALNTPMSISSDYLMSSYRNLFQSNKNTFKLKNPEILSCLSERTLFKVNTKETYYYLTDIAQSCKKRYQGNTTDVVTGSLSLSLNKFIELFYPVSKHWDKGNNKGTRTMVIDIILEFCYLRTWWVVYLLNQFKMNVSDHIETRFTLIYLAY